MKISSLIIILAICNMSLSTFLSDNDNKHQFTKLKIIFEKFIHTFEKIYDSVEERDARFLIFADNVLTHLPELLTAEVLNFSPYLDLTQNEFKNQERKRQVADPQIFNKG